MQDKKYENFSGFLYRKIGDERGAQAKFLKKLDDNGINVDAKTLRNWVYGYGFPTVDKLLPLADLLDVTVDELLRGYEEDSAAERKCNNLRRIRMLSEAEAEKLYKICQCSKNREASLYFMIDSKACRIRKDPLSYAEFVEAYKEKQRAEFLPEHLSRFLDFFFESNRAIQEEREKHKQSVDRKLAQELARYTDIEFVGGEEITHLYESNLYRKEAERQAELTDEEILEALKADSRRGAARQEEEKQGLLIAHNYYSFGETDFSEAEMLDAIVSGEEERRKAVLLALEEQKKAIRKEYFEPLEKSGLIEIVKEELQTVVTDVFDERYPTFAWRIDVEVKLTKAEAESFAGDYFVKKHFTEDA